MRRGRKISHLLLMIVLCILIFYVGIYMQMDGSKEEIPFNISRTVVEKAEQMYFPALFYENNVSGEQRMWLAAQVMKAFPIVGYVEEKAQISQVSEDEDMYEMILSLQANDENEVDANGNLVENKSDKNSDSSENIKYENIEMNKLKDYEYLISHFYTVDGSTSVKESLLDAEKLLKKDMSIDLKEAGPKVLVYHTHSQEAFKDSRKGKVSDTIMGMGAYLSELLNEKYGIETLHHEGVYDLIDGRLDRSKAYQLALPQIEKIIKDNPSIEVVIDLHRDGVKESTHLVTEIDKKQTAQIMFFNGMSRTRTNGDISYLANPYIEDNLAFSLQMQLYAAEKYPGFTRRIYLKSYRYNMHLMPKTLLIEAGAQTNTVEEMKNAMEVLASVLDGVLKN